MPLTLHSFSSRQNADAISGGSPTSTPGHNFPTFLPLQSSIQPSSISRTRNENSLLPATWYWPKLRRFLIHCGADFLAADEAYLKARTDENSAATYFSVACGKSEAEFIALFAERFGCGYFGSDRLCSHGHRIPEIPNGGNRHIFRLGDGEGTVALVPSLRDFFNIISVTIPEQARNKLLLTDLETYQTAVALSKLSKAAVVPTADRDGFNAHSLPRPQEAQDPVCVRLKSTGGRSRFAISPPALMRAPNLRTSLKDSNSNDQIYVTDKKTLRSILRKQNERHWIKDITNSLETTTPIFSAKKPLDRRQIAGICLAAIGACLLVMTFPFLAVISAASLGLLFFAGRTLMHTLALISSLNKPKAAECPPLTDDQLPQYTVLIPLYHEVEIVEDLMAQLNLLDYPSDKLDIKLIVEEDDQLTRAALEEALRKCRRPRLHTFDLIVVPEGKPKTKPRAIQYALQSSTGQLVTIFDAEDRPEPNQLRQAAQAFANGAGDLGCLQARLVIDHPTETFFSRLFALEYATLFDGLLPWASRLGLAFPLGGTSNHFRREALEQVGGWDPYNVTEDADLGLRLARYGWKLSMLSSVTYEEAPLKFQAWMHQRVRWMKGWMQTIFVHCRQPMRCFRELGWRNSWLFLLLLLGAIVSILAHPFVIGYSLLSISGWVQQTGLGSSEFSAAFSLGTIFGYGSVMLLTYVSARQRALAINPLWILMLPFYWLLMALAVLFAVVELVRDPWRWRKTMHGQSRSRPS